MTRFVACVVVLAFFAARAVAEGDDGGEAKPADGEAKAAASDPKAEPVDMEKAKELLKKLDEAVEAKEEAGILSALESFFTASHEDFVKDLQKVATHRSVAVRVAAVKALGSQGPAKRVGPILLNLLKAKPNSDFPAVQGMCVSSMRRLAFDAKAAFDEIRSLFVKPADIDVMRECVKYFRDLKRYDCVSLLVYWVEQPQPASVNSGSNPPESYWKRMWEIWSSIKNEVRDALKTLTGQEFESEKVWRDWIDSPEAKKMGVK